MKPGTVFRRAGGSPLTLGRELGAGGEARVYAVAGEARAVKLYHHPSAEHSRKLSAMIHNPPDDPTAGSGHVAIAWPQELVYRGSQVVGFTMPLIDSAKSIALYQLYHPKSRAQRAPGITWRYLLRIAHNLCAVVAALHAKGYVIGDLNESNVLVAGSALVTLVDCDSVQVRVAGKTLRCPVGKEHTTAPELQGRRFGDLDRTPQHDLFALAVLIFLLLMEGVSPFAGVYRGAGEPPTPGEVICRGLSPYLSSRVLHPPLTAPPLATLPPDLQRLLRRALARPRLRRRPSAQRWQRALRDTETTLRACQVGPHHVYSQHLETCPWCERARRLGVDAYPSGHGGAHARPTLPRPRALAAPKTHPGPSLPRFYRTLPTLSTLLALIGTTLGVVWADVSLRVIGPLPWFFYYPLFAALALLPTTLVALGLYVKASRAPPLRRGLEHSDRLLRAALLSLMMASTLLVTLLWLSRASAPRYTWPLAVVLWALVYGAGWVWRRRARG